MEKAKLKTMDRLAAKGFDTEKKVNAIDMVAAYENELSDELGGIIELQKAIRAHRLYAYLYGGKDPAPVRKEAGNDAKNGNAGTDNSNWGQ